MQDNYTDPSTGVRRLIPDYLRYKAGAYWVGEYIPSNDFSAEVGLRFDYDHIDAQKYYRIAVWNDRGYDVEYSSTIIRTTSASNYLTRHIKNFGNLSASTGLKQRFGKSTVALFNLGYISRSPNPAELFSDGLHHALATIELGDLRLTQERAMKPLVSLEKSTLEIFATRSPCSTIVLTITSFYNQEKQGLIKRAIVPFWFVNTQLPQVNMKGLDLDLSYRFSAKFNYKGTAAWVSAKTKEGTPLIDTPLNIQQQLAYSPIQDNPLRLVFQTAFVAEQTQVPDFNFNYNFFENGAIVSRLVDISLRLLPIICSAFR